MSPAGNIARLGGPRRLRLESKIHNAVRRLRFESGEMTQQALADRVGVTRQAIVAIEGGKYAPSLELAFRIASAFGKPLADVFQYDVDDRPSA